MRTEPMTTPKDKPGVVPPPPPPANRLPAPPPRLDETPTNMGTPTEDLVTMNFKVPPRLRMQFKSESSMRGMSMRDMLEASFKFYCQKFPRKMSADNIEQDD